MGKNPSTARHRPRYGALRPLNSPAIASHSTLAIRANPEIGLAAGGGTAAGVAAAPDAAGALLTTPAASCAFRLLANWFMICVAVAWIMPTPRPYWATAPDSDRSVCTSTLDPLGAPSSRN